MSLITLTFGRKNANTDNGQHAFVSTPAELLARAIRKTGSTKGEVIVKKACTFYGLEDVYVVAEVMNGFVCEGMKAFLNNAEYELISLESKYGNTAKKGMTVGLTLNTPSREEFPAGSVIRLEKN